MDRLVGVAAFLRCLDLGLNRRFGFGVCSAAGKLTLQLLDDSLGKLGLDAQSHPFEVGGARLGARPARLHSAADPPPDVQFPSNIQGQQIAVDANGYIGYVAGFPDDTLYSFNINTLQLEDPDGLVLPGNPDRIALGGHRLALVDTTNKRCYLSCHGQTHNGYSYQ